MALTRPRYSQIYDTDYKQSVTVATTGDVGNVYAAGTLTNTIDGVGLSYLDRILVKNQTDAKQNGIYEVLVVGTGSNGTWRRSLDTNTDDKVTSGLRTSVSSGTVNTGKEFRLITNDPIVVGTTNLVFTDVVANPTGSNTQVQFNDAGVMGASSSFTFDKTANVLGIGGNITALSTTANGNIGLAPKGAGFARVFGTNGLVIPRGNTAQQGPQETGAIRFNTETSQFEGFGGTNWSSLGGVRSVDGLTYITAEATVGASDDILHFYASNNTVPVEVARLNTANLLVNISTPSTSTTTGAFNVLGGAGIAGNLYVGGTYSAFDSNLIVGNTYTSTYKLEVYTPGTLGLKVGHVNTTGPVGGSGSILRLENRDYGASSVSNIIWASYDGGNVSRHSGAIQFGKEGGAWVSAGGNYPGYMAFFTRPSGADELERLRIDSGGNINVGGSNVLTYANLSIYHTTPSTSTATGALQVAGGAGIKGNLYVGSTQQATSTSTGALVVSGGASIGQDLWVAGNIYSANINSVTYGLLTINDPLVYLNSNVTYPYNYTIGLYSHFVGGPSNVYAHTGFVRSPDDNRWHLVSNVAEPTYGNLNIFDTNKIYDALVTGSHTIVGNIITTGNITAQGPLQANATTVSTDGTTGALTVLGGVGISGNLNVGGNARVLSDTGHILVGDRIRAANVANVWVQGVAAGITGDRPFTLIDSSAVVKVVRPGGDPSLELQAWDSTISTQNAYWDFAAQNSGGNLIIRDRTVGGAGTVATFEKVTGNVTFTGNLRVNNDINFVGNVIHADSGDPVGYIRYLDNISDQFDGSTKKFLITYDDGTVYDVNNPLQLQVFVGGIIVPPARYIRDYFNLPEVAVFDHGFYLQKGLNDANAVVINTVTTNTAGNIGNLQVSSGGNTIVFATAPTSSMDFQAFVRTNSDPQPAFKFKQTPFTALNIMLGS